ncbi:MAG: hypothetical protein HC915_07350 [Anaerolineae bacterium]|nr:hypothetical protein [Anaerolineae bacterium]
MPIEIRAQDRAGLMWEIGEIAAQENINMTNIRATVQTGKVLFSATMEIDNYATLTRALNKIEQLESVLTARRKGSQPS